MIDEPWVSMIAAGEKTWELRSGNTSVRGRIALIRKRSKTVIGVAELVGTIPKISRSELKDNVVKHRVPAGEIDDNFKYDTAWVMERARSLPEPVAYRHPTGAVIWVNLHSEVVTAIEQQTARARSQGSPSHPDEDPS